MYKTAFNKQAKAHSPTMPEGYRNHFRSQRCSPGEEAFFKHSEKIKEGKEKLKAKKQASLSLRKFSFE